jgi:hypothetical protein
VNNRRFFVIALGLAIAAPGALQAVAATPTPVPGGANQLSGVSGGLGSTLFNGKVRIRHMALRPSTADEYTPSGGQHGLVLTYLVSNGTSKERAGTFSASISDADGVVVDGKPVSVYSAYYSLIPGAAAHGTIQFILPADFKPVKIVLTDQGGPAGPAFRILLQPTDVPAPAAT